MAHDVDVRIGSKLVRRWTEYEVESDMLNPADSFSLGLAPVDSELYELCAPDTAVQVLIDGAPVLRGLIGERSTGGDRSSGDVIRISGMDLGGRLLEESMDLISFKDLTIGALVAQAAAPWFTTVTFSNARNRDLVRGRRSGKARAASEPAGLVARKGAPKKVSPGETRWETMVEFLEGSEILIWSSGDGKEIVIGRPNYQQEPQYRFFVAAAGSTRTREVNVVRWEERDSVDERYSQVTVVGAGKGDSYNYGQRLIKNQGHALNGSGTSGIGSDFTHRKILIIGDDNVRSPADAKQRAELEMASRDAKRHVVTLTLRGHGQPYQRGQAPTLYAFDTVCHYENEVTGAKGRYLITRVRFREDRVSGQTTEIEMVPTGTRLSL